MKIIALAAFLAAVAAASVTQAADVGRFCSNIREHWYQTCVDHTADGTFERPALGFCAGANRVDDLILCLDTVKDGHFQEEALAFCEVDDPDNNQAALQCLGIIRNARFDPYAVNFCRTNQIELALQCIELIKNVSYPDKQSIDACAQHARNRDALQCLRNLTDQVRRGG